MKNFFGSILILIGIGNLAGFIDSMVNPNFGGMRYGDSIIAAIIFIGIGIWIISYKKEKNEN